MTAAQKTAKANFLKAIDYRKKTGVSLKEAFAKVYGKKVVSLKKKAAPKKVAKKKVGAMKMSSDNFDRMDSLTSIPELRKFTYAAGAIIQDLHDEGFEPYEIKEYLIINLENILKRF